MEGHSDSKHSNKIIVASVRLQGFNIKGIIDSTDILNLNSKELKTLLKMKIYIPIV